MSELTGPQQDQIEDVLAAVPGVLKKTDSSIIVQVNYVTCPRMTTEEILVLQAAKNKLHRDFRSTHWIEFEGIRAEIDDDATHDEVCGLPHDEGEENTIG